jgi:hypothetical protein
VEDFHGSFTDETKQRGALVQKLGNPKFDGRIAVKNRGYALK